MTAIAMESEGKRTLVGGERGGSEQCERIVNPSIVH